jgi:YD repeat-containing protein
LRITGDAFGIVAGALDAFAGVLGGLQDRMRPVAARAPGLWAAVQAARGRVDAAGAADRRHAEEVADRAGDDARPDTYRSDSAAASTALGEAQRQWDECVGQASGLRGELDAAVGACVGQIASAKEMRFKENPKWYDIGGHFTNFVREHKDVLQQLSGALKIVSLVAGLLAFIPVLTPIMAPIALGTALAASAIDLSVYAATGEGSLKMILIDVGLNLLPGVGRVARMGAGALRGTRVATAFSSVATRGRNMLSVARWGLASPRANGIEAARRLIRMDPIDIASGDMVLRQTDVALPGLLPLVLSRTHISSYRLGSLFGRSWASTLDQRLEADEAGVYVAIADGMTLIYPRPADREPVLPVEGPRWRLRRLDPDAYAVEEPTSGWTWHYSRPPDTGQPPSIPVQWPLTAITDRLGQRIDVVRAADGTPVEVRHSGGYRVGVEVTGNRVTALRLIEDDEHATLLIRFGYNAAGDLTEVINSADLPLRYEYDIEGRITEWADRNGTRYGYEYDEAGRCVATTGTGGCLTGRLRYDHGATTVVDSYGHATVYRINDLIQVESETDPLGNVTRYTWDRYDRKLSQTDPLGRTTRFRYDEEGNQVEIVRPDGSRTFAVYGPMGRPVEVVDYDGGRWRREYDERGNLTTVRDPAGSMTRYGYGDSGHLAEVIDPTGRTTRVGTNASGLTGSWPRPAPGAR